MSQFMYVLSLQPPFKDFSTWTAREHDIVDRHFETLQRLAAVGTVILAGRQLTEDPTGIVILDVDNEPEARSLMKSDPAVQEGLMTAQLSPFHVALLRGES